MGTRESTGTPWSLRSTGFGSTSGGRCSGCARPGRTRRQRTSEPRKHSRAPPRLCGGARCNKKKFFLLLRGGVLRLVVRLGLLGLLRLLCLLRLLLGVGLGRL